MQVAETISIHRDLRTAPRGAREREEHAERLNAIRARIRRSLDDPRPALTLDQVDAHLDELFAEAEKAEKDAHRA